MKVTGSLLLICLLATFFADSQGFCDFDSDCFLPCSQSCLVPSEPGCFKHKCWCGVDSSGSSPQGHNRPQPQPVPIRVQPYAPYGKQAYGPVPLSAGAMRN